MPTVVNGIGTWYYGKRRIYRRTDECEFCRRRTDLQSYDTTLFFVVFFIPVIPLGTKRILHKCGICEKHRVISRAKWDEIKLRDGAELMEKLHNDPKNRDAALAAIAFALGYQDEPLFNEIVDSYVGDPAGDPLMQDRLGDAYHYFSRWPEAEQAYFASLQLKDDEFVREKLAWALLQQNRPEEARPLLQHILDDKKESAIGMIYYLVEGYQAQGLHAEALEILNQRDQAFPSKAGLKEYQRQRKTSVRYQNSAKKVRSANLGRGGAGYSEGNWTARLPYAIAASVFLGLLALYLGIAASAGYARKVFLVNGTTSPYTVTVQGKDYALTPRSATAVNVSEGDLQVDLRGVKGAIEPIRARIETNFWTRPFVGRTFVINPDQSAIVVEEERYYAEFNPPAGKPDIVHFGQGFYDLPGVDYEFQNFPATLRMEKGSQARKTRVGFAATYAPETRLSLAQDLEPEEQSKFCKRLLQIDPNDSLFLQWFTSRFPTQETIDYVETRLDDRPVRVEWHRAYQTLMEKLHLETDLRDRYRNLLAEGKQPADALYLLGRVEPDLDASKKLYQQAAAADPPSAHALAGLGYRALSDGRFAEARGWFEKALPLLTDKLIAEQFYRESLLANGDFDLLLKRLEPDALLPDRMLTAKLKMSQVYSARGDKLKARQKLAEALATLAPNERQMIERATEAMVCLWGKDVDGYLKATDATSSFEAKLLSGRLDEAATLTPSNGPDAIEGRGVLYLAAVRDNKKELAAEQWTALLDELNKGDRDERSFGDLLAGRKQSAAATPEKLAIDPKVKRVLLAVLAQRYPAKSKELLALSRRLDYQRDAISLCLEKVLKK